MNRKLKIIIPILIMLLLINNTIVLGKRIKTENTSPDDNTKSRGNNADKSNNGKGRKKVTTGTDPITPDPGDPSPSPSPTPDPGDPSPSPSPTPDPGDPSPLPPPPEPKVEVDVFKDPECTQLLENFEWGEIEPGTTSTQTVYIKNNGDVNLILTLSSDNFNPTNLVDNMNLYWDYDGSPIAPGEILKVQITLLIKSDCLLIDTFSFDVIITGS